MGLFKFPKTFLSNKRWIDEKDELFLKNNLDPEQLAGRYSPEIKEIARVGEFWIVGLNKRLEK